MRSIAFADFLIGLGILFVLEGLMFAASPAWMRRAMKSALATPDSILRVVGIGSAVAGLILSGRYGGKAFCSEVDTGSPRENASNRESSVPALTLAPGAAVRPTKTLS